MRRFRVMAGVPLIAALALIAGRGTAQAAARSVQTFELQEHLGHEWSHELVFFRLTDDARRAAQRGACLLNPRSEAISFQILEQDGQAAIAFLADLPAFQQVAYRLVANHSGRTPQTGLQWKDDPGEIRLWNDRIGIAVSQRLLDGAGPIKGIRLESGRWIGGSRLAGTPGIDAYEARLSQTGPVFAEIECKCRWSDGKLWTITFRVIAGEPVVVVRESFDRTADSQWRLLLHPNFQPNQAAYRTNLEPGAPLNANYVRGLLQATDESPFLLSPWAQWWDPRSVSCVSLFKTDPATTCTYSKKDRVVRIARGGHPVELSNDDVVFVAAGHGGDWVEPGESGPDAAIPLRTMPQGEVCLDFPMREHRRYWIIGATTLDKTIVADQELADAQRYMIKYCETPLDQVKDMILEWPSKATPSDYPRLFFGPDDLDATRRRIDESAASSNPRYERLRKSFLDRSDAANKALRERLLPNVEQAVRTFTDDVQHWDPEGKRSVVRHSASVWTHHICRLVMVQTIWLDQLLGRKEALPPQQWKRLRSQAAFLAYKMADPDYYSFERGWHANPNMTTMRHSVVGLLACLLWDHPKSRQWFEVGLSEITRELDNWVGPNGGWLECPHYQSLIGDGIMLLLAGHRAGLSDRIYDEHLLKSIVYLAKISTPPDPRFDDRRHMPAAGNTYRFETTGLFAILAKLHRARNPQVADDLQWMWQQHGRPMWTGIGGGSEIAQVMDFLVDDSRPGRPPNWGSEVFPNSGTILRSHFPSHRETQLYVLHGKFFEHYDFDRGSFALWGKGQPLCLDWGYHGRMPSTDHSMMDIGNDGEVTAFSTQAATDHVHVDLGDWQRQILFVKDADPERPNFFLIHDSTSGDGDAQWYQWFYTGMPPERDGDILRVHGQADVDLDVWFAGERAQQFPRLSDREAAALVTDMAGKPTGRPRFVKSRVLDVPCPEGTGDGSNKIQSMRQYGVQLTIPRGESVVAAFYPRLQTQQPPTFEQLADGCGVRVESQFGVDYAFVAPKPFVFQQADIGFEGTAGTVQVRGSKVTLVLAAAGKIRYGDHELVSDVPRSQTFRLP